MKINTFGSLRSLYTGNSLFKLSKRNMWGVSPAVADAVEKVSLKVLKKIDSILDDPKKAKDIYTKVVPSRPLSSAVVESCASCAKSSKEIPKAFLKEITRATPLYDHDFFKYIMIGAAGCTVLAGSYEFMNYIEGRDYSLLPSNPAFLCSAILHSEETTIAFNLFLEMNTKFHSNPYYYDCKNAAQVERGLLLDYFHKLRKLKTSNLYSCLTNSAGLSIAGELDSNLIFYIEGHQGVFNHVTFIDSDSKAMVFQNLIDIKPSSRSTENPSIDLINDKLVPIHSNFSLLL